MCHRPVCYVSRLTDWYVVHHRLVCCVSQTCALCVTDWYLVGQTCMLCATDWYAVCGRPVCCVSQTGMLVGRPVCCVWQTCMLCVADWLWYVMCHRLVCCVPQTCMLYVADLLVVCHRLVCCVTDLLVVCHRLVCCVLQTCKLYLVCHRPVASVGSVSLTSMLGFSVTYNDICLGCGHRPVSCVSHTCTFCVLD